MANEKTSAYPVHLDRNHLPEPEWKFPNAKIDYAKKGLFPFTGAIESATFAFGAHKQPTGMDRLKLATRMN